MRMNPAFKGSFVLQRFERYNVIEICNGIIFNFYSGMLHIFLFVLNTQIIKTQTARIPDLSTFVEANHPYDVPEVISMNVSHIFCRLPSVCMYKLFSPVLTSSTIATLRGFVSYFPFLLSSRAHKNGWLE